MNPIPNDQSFRVRSELWYRDGLRFRCMRCGNCCGGGPGTIRVTDGEIRALAEHLHIACTEFRERYARDVGDRYVSLREKPNYNCIFYDEDAGCTVYAARPRQCRTWPFWRGVVASRQRWVETGEECPGINQGPLYSAGYIERTSTNDGTLGTARRLERI
jgi:Fe-S-cluster containining protein